MPERRSRPVRAIAIALVAAESRRRLLILHCLLAASLVTLLAIAVP